MFDLKQGALLFDCDGTITDEKFLPSIVGRAIKEIIEAQGLEFDPDVFDSVFDANKGGGFDKYYLGYLNATNSAHLLNHVDIHAFSEKAITKYLETTEAIARGEDVGVRFDVNHDAVNIIQWANEQGIPVVIVTNANSRIVRANLQAAGIGILGETTGNVRADMVVDRSFYGENAINRKPSGYPYQEACRQISNVMDRVILPENCIGFEDSANGHLSMFRANVGLRVHVCEHSPEEAVHFVRDGEHFSPDAVAPYGSLTSGFITGMIDSLNNMGRIISMTDFPVAAANGSASLSPLGEQRPRAAQIVAKPA